MMGKFGGVYLSETNNDTYRPNVYVKVKSNTWAMFVCTEAGQGDIDHLEMSKQLPKEMQNPLGLLKEIWNTAFFLYLERQNMYT